jgi:hypothetical protein
MIAIDSGEVLAGDLPPRALKLVAEWTDLHRGELEADWARAKMAAHLSQSTHCRKMMRWTS